MSTEAPADPEPARDSSSETPDEASGATPTEGGGKPNRRWRVWARDLAVILVIVFGIQWWQARNVAAEGLPEIDVTLLDGSVVPLHGARERPTLVQMMASWCGVCRMEESTIRSLAADHDVLVIASQSGDAEAVRRFAEEHELAHLRIALDQDGSLARRLGVSAFPTTLFVDRGGRIASIAVGYTTWLGMRARLGWASL